MSNIYKGRRYHSKYPVQTTLRKGKQRIALIFTQLLEKRQLIITYQDDGESFDYREEFITL